MLNTVESFLEPCQTIIDLYSGVGFFIPLLRKYAQHVTGVESAGFAVTLAKRAFAKEGIQLTAIAAEKFSFPKADVILVDPPRSGLCKRVMNSILQKKYPKLIFISCASATFARDLKTLHESGYRLERLFGFDLFPQTPHQETISLFIKTC
jgi:23S rRNA (uracil1939-C5)-methyltransferase